MPDKAADTTQKPATPTTPANTQVAAPATAPEPPKPKQVAFQYDRDTTLIADVIKERDNGSLDLLVHNVAVSAFVTNVSMPPGDREHLNVRPGSKFEPGSWFELPAPPAIDHTKAVADAKAIVDAKQADLDVATAQHKAAQDAAAEAAKK